MGLCFGGGQLQLGLAVLALGMFVLIVLKWFEDRIGAEHHALLVLSCQSSSLDEQDLRAVFRGRIQNHFLWRDVLGRSRSPQATVPRGLVRAADRLAIAADPAQLAQRPGVLKVDWQP